MMKVNERQAILILGDLQLRADSLIGLRMWEDRGFTSGPRDMVDVLIDGVGTVTKYKKDIAPGQIENARSQMLKHCSIAECDRWGVPMYPDATSYATDSSVGEVPKDPIPDHTLNPEDMPDVFEVKENGSENYPCPRCEGSFTKPQIPNYGPDNTVAMYCPGCNHKWIEKIK